ncbi:MAG TPA: hypothetical protein VGQ90_11890 [Stellaceae bacterium]|jgi:hypothetical protein|nr:hypothetical protein [Stellaceae bacterium]
MDGGGFIRELCIALEHRWKPEELFLLFTAYFDESDTHGSAPTIIMSAFLGHARQWEIFGRKLRTLQKTEHFSIFHGKEIKAGAGEFLGWELTKRMSVVNKIADLVRDELEDGIAIHLEYDRYINEYRGSYTPRGVALDSQYGVCFRMLLSYLVNALTATGKKHNLHVVLERGHQNALNCERIFNELKESVRAKGIELLGTFTLASKAEAPPLMVADFLAYSYKMMRIPGGIGLDGYPETAPKKGEAGLTFLGLAPNALQRLKLEMQQDRLFVRAYKRNVAVRAAKNSPPS